IDTGRASKIRIECGGLSARYSTVNRILMLGKYFVRRLAAVVSCAVAMMAAQTRTPAGPYTAEQAAAGRTAYEAYCASCHLPDLAGRNEAPALAGTNFMRVWGARTMSTLLQYMQTTMPPGNRGGFGQETYVDLVAFLLEANGARAGERPLTAAAASSIGSIATGQMPVTLRQSLLQSGASRP